MTAHSIGIKLCCLQQSKKQYHIHRKEDGVGDGSHGFFPSNIVMIGFFHYNLSLVVVFKPKAKITKLVSVLHWRKMVKNIFCSTYKGQVMSV